MFSVRPAQLTRTARSLQSTQLPAWSISTRQAHKLVEVELQDEILGLGIRGDRVPVAPGRARTLQKDRRAFYVVKGLAVSPMRDLLRKVSRMESAQAERDRLLRESLAPVEPAVEVDPQEALRTLEIDLRTALSLVPTPLSFHRRLIHAPTSLPGQQPSPTPANSEIFGSVSVLDVITSLREFGVVVDEAQAAFEEGMGVEKGRLKATGRFEFVVQLKALGEKTGIEVEVVREV
ncbi:hypothetical protein P7C70_g5744, partial [Phenoliferia sp. Uapishka_3]